MQSLTRIALALVALSACKAPDPGKKNKPAAVEAGLGVDPLGGVLSGGETPKDPKPESAQQPTAVPVRGWDPQDKKEVVGKATSSTRAKP